MLSEQVQAGTLPPLEERLPQDPLVVEPIANTGGYGGVWRGAVSGPGDTAEIYRTIGYEQLFHWDPEWTDVVPNVAESVEIIGDGQGYLVALRQGIKWSDGESFTADDVVFAYDVLLDDDLFGMPAFLVPSGAPGTVEKVDDYSVQFSFESGNGLFLEFMASPDGDEFTIRPKHYLQQFHKDYNDEVEQLAQEEGFPSWAELFLARATWQENADLPTIHAWQLTVALGEESRVRALRNPYYWKTDPDGSQLPYLDEVVYDVVDSEEALLLKATNGELDTHFTTVNTLANKPVLASHAEENEYHFHELVSSDMNRLGIAFNLNHQDPQLREVFQNRDFRIGLSHAINRDEIIDAVYQRQGEPWQLAPRRESEFYSEELAKQYTEFDADLANDFLDRAGYAERDSQGFRLGSDGQRISFTTEVALFRPTFIRTMELVQGYWEDVGIDMRVTSIDTNLWFERIFANELDVLVWLAEGGLKDAMFKATWYFPVDSGICLFATQWQEWYTSGGSSGEEPPEAPRQQMELYDQIKGTVDQERRDELFEQILSIAKEQFYAIGITLSIGDYGIVTNGLHGVLEPMPISWFYPNPGPTNPEQYSVMT